VSALKIKIDPLGTPQQDFYRVKHQLALEGCKFDSATLPSLSYNQLPLACIGTAGPTMCALDLVQSEKRQRRERFLTMDEETLQGMKNYLLIERMWEDVLFERTYSILPHWDNLTDRQKIWLRLNCVNNHVDSPNARMTEVVGLLAKCLKNGELPLEISTTFTSKLRSLLQLYPKHIDDSTFRDRITVLTSHFFQFLPVDEAKQIENEEIQNYSCTSDCYRILKTD
jgi:hypothetical protein